MRRSDQVETPGAEAKTGARVPELSTAHADPAAPYPRISIPSRPAVVATGAGLVVIAVLVAASSALPIFIAGLALAYLIDPAVTAAARHGVPRWLGTIGMIAILLVVALVFEAMVATTVISQGAAFVDRAPAAFEDLRNGIATAPLSPALRDPIERWLDNTAAAAGGIDVGGILASAVNPLFAFLGVVFAAIGLPFYVFLLVVDRPGLSADVSRALPDRWRADVLAVIGIVVRQFGNYVRSRAVLMVLVGAATWIGLIVLSIVIDPRIASSAIFLAVVAAICELIPLFGPWISGLAAALFGISIGPDAFLAIVALYGVISFVEGNVLVPAIEGRSFDLRPAVIGPVIAIGVVLGGTFGAIVAVPVASAARDVYLYVFRRSMGVPIALAIPDHSSARPDSGDRSPGEPRDVGGGSA